MMVASGAAPRRIAAARIMVCPVRRVLTPGLNFLFAVAPGFGSFVWVVASSGGLMRGDTANAEPGDGAFLHVASVLLSKSLMPA